MHCTLQARCSSLPLRPAAPTLTLVQRPSELGAHVAVGAGTLRFHCQRNEQGRVRGFGATRGRGGGGGQAGDPSWSPGERPHEGAKGGAGGRPRPSPAPRREPSPQQGTPRKGHRDRGSNPSRENPGDWALISDARWAPAELKDPERGRAVPERA